METRFSDRISALKPSLIREILKAPSGPDIITLAAGNPSPESFPAEEMGLLASDIFARKAASALQYGVTEGYEPLRHRVRERLRQKFGIDGADDELIITSGGQQAVELCAKVLLNEGDTVLCEQPSFIGALNALRSYNVRLKGVPCGAEGMDMDALEALLSEGDVRLIYTIPTFQNPTGAVMPLASRRRLLALAARFGVMVLEDDPYYELRYDGEAVPQLKSMDENGQVVYAGSFSKLIAPGIRLGYALGPKAVISKMVVAKQVNDVHTNLFFQILVDAYMEQYDFEAHIAHCCGLYRARRDAMQSAALQYFGDRADWRKPEGGLFFWLTLRGQKDGTELCRLAKERGVMAVPGTAFMVDESASGSIRLNFSLPSETQITEGMRRVSAALDTIL